MKENSIQSLSIDDLRKYQDTERCSIYKGVLVGKGGPKNTHHPQLFNEPIRINTVTFILIIQGEGKITIDQKEISYRANTLIMVPPRSIIVADSTQSEQSKTMVLMLDQLYMSECNLNVKKITQHILSVLQSNLAIQMSEAETQRLLQALEMLTLQINANCQSIFSEDIIRSTVEMITYLCMELFSLHSATEESVTTTLSTRSDEYFHRFLKLLSQHYLERQPVTYYAHQLCISSRYLTTIVRRASGLSVTQWMNRYILTEAKYLLKYSELSIQEIAYKLSFPNQSFFGKYFKQHTGSSPSVYRARF